MDKKITINGLDVTKCKYLCCGKVCSWFNDDCKNYDVCYYKQLKQKEQECELLNNVAQKHLAETLEMQTIIDKLKKSLEEIEVIYLAPISFDVNEPPICPSQVNLRYSALEGERHRLILEKIHEALNG